MKRVIRIVGHFPPPLHGQSMQTKLLAELLSEEADVETFNTSVDTEAPVSQLARVTHYLSIRGNLRAFLSRAPGEPVIWSSISPSPQGHYRDRFVALPAFGPSPVIASVHWGDFSRLFSTQSTRRSAKAMVPRIRCFVFTDPGLADECAEWIPEEKRCAIPNTIDTETVCSPAEIQEKQERHRKSEGTTVLFLSNMIPEKGYLDVLSALAMLRKGGHRVRGLFAGSWSSREAKDAFFERVTELELVDTVQHLGHVRDRAQIKRLHMEADVFALPSYYATEAQPMAIIESLNAATPVVATRHASIPSMVRHGKNGFLVEPRAPEQIADAIERLAQPDQWTSASTSARNHFDELYGRSAIRARWIRIVDRYVHHAPVVSH